MILIVSKLLTWCIFLHTTTSVSSTIGEHIVDNKRRHVVVKMVTVHAITTNCQNILSNCHTRKRRQKAEKSVEHRIIQQIFGGNLGNKWWLVPENTMLRICHRLGAWHSAYRRTVPAAFGASYPPALSPCPQAFLANKQSESLPLNQIPTRTFIKEMFGEPPDPESVDIYNGCFAKKLEFLKLISVLHVIVGVGKYNEIYNAILQNLGTNATISVCTVAGAAIIYAPYALHKISKKYVVEITYNPRTDVYKAALISLWMSKKYVRTIRWIEMRMNIYIFILKLF